MVLELAQPILVKEYEYGNRSVSWFHKPSQPILPVASEMVFYATAEPASNGYGTVK